MRFYKQAYTYVIIKRDNDSLSLTFKSLAQAKLFVKLVSVCNAKIEMTIVSNLSYEVIQ